jgi:hypothetical protein
MIDVDVANKMTKKKYVLIFYFSTLQIYILLHNVMKSEHDWEFLSDFFVLHAGEILVGDKK